MKVPPYLYIFAHIPKTGGTYLREVVERSYQNPIRVIRTSAPYVEPQYCLQKKRILRAEDNVKLKQFISALLHKYSLREFRSSHAACGSLRCT